MDRRRGIANMNRPELEAEIARLQDELGGYEAIMTQRLRCREHDHAAAVARAEDAEEQLAEARVAISKRDQRLTNREHEIARLNRLLTAERHELGDVADALPLGDWTPGDCSHAEAVARVVRERNRLLDEVKVRRGTAEVEEPADCVMSSSAAEDLDSVLRLLDTWYQSVSNGADYIGEPMMEPVAARDLRSAWHSKRRNIGLVIRNGGVALVSKWHLGVLRETAWRAREQLACGGDRLFGWLGNNRNAIIQALAATGDDVTD